MAVTKLAVYNRRNFPNRLRTDEPWVTFCPNDGRVILSKAACKVVGVEKGDMIEFVQDRERPSRFGIRKCQQDGFTLGKRDGSLVFACRMLASAILSMLGNRSERQSLMVDKRSDDGINWLIVRP